MSKSLVDRILDKIFDSEWTGRHGEKLTERELKLVRLFGRKGRILRNVYVPKENGETSEIDVLYITQKGIFVIESKNYSGWIFGNEKDAYWVASLPNGEKNRFYNPVKQNKTHLKWLQQYVGDHVPLFSIVVFSERCELKKISMLSSDVKVIKRDRIYATIRNIWDTAEDAVDEEGIAVLHEKLLELTDVDKAVKKAHVERIKEKYFEKENPGATAAPAINDIAEEITSESENVDLRSVTTDTFICPRCGRKMVLRTAKKGANAGRQFYGCSGFPECRYTQNK